MKAILCTALLVAACSPGGSGGWVAEVDGRKISLEELKRGLPPPGGGESPQERDEALLAELERLIRNRLVLNRAEDLGIRVSDAELESMLESLPGLAELRDDSRYREEVRKEMLMDRVALLELGASLEVPESALELRLEEEKARFESRPTIEVRQIVVSDPTKARRLLRALRNGESFEAVARENSLGPEAKDGGLLPPFARSELPEAFDVAFELRPGQLSDVVESPFGYHIFRLERVIEAQPPDPERIREEIHAELERERFVALREDWVRMLRGKAEIRINREAVDAAR